MQTILVTGGCGFIGSNFIKYYLKKKLDVFILNLDKLTYAGNLDNLKSIEKEERYKFIKGDICDTELVENIFKKHQVKGVFNFAAESHVDNSISNPEHFIETNIKGTFILLEAAKNSWMESPFKTKDDYKNARFHHISTDEVYGSLGKEGLFSEKTPYAPNSPYSASKASSDFLVRSYHKTYGLNVVTTNCSNNYGPNQHDEKLIPTIIRKAIKGENIPIYGNGKNVREWLFVEDHCKGIDIVFKNGKSGETYNIGSNNEHTNLLIAEQICEILDDILPKKTSYKNQITFVEDRLGHDFRYAIDATKIEKELAWKANEDFETGLKKTIQWYLKKYQ